MPAPGTTNEKDREQESSRVTLREPVEAHPHRCEAAGIYCGALGLPELVAAGRARMCCLHYYAPAVECEAAR